MNGYHLLTTHTYNVIYDMELRPNLSFPIMHTFYQVSEHALSPFMF